MLLQKQPCGGRTLVVPLFVIDLAWQLRFIHGGADAKALMWVTLLFPSWAEVPSIDRIDG